MKANKDFNDWRSKQAKMIPELAARIFALRNRFYMGCGFHWSIEKRLGGIIHGLNDYDSDYYHTEEGLAKQIVLEVSIEALYKDVLKAEESAEELAKKNELIVP